MNRRTSFAARIALGAIKSYKRLISPLFTGSCRFLPSCSDYMAEAVERHGALIGIGLGLARIGRCHPFGGSGLDPVPQHLRRRQRVHRDDACCAKHETVTPACHPNAVAASGMSATCPAVALGRRRKAGVQQGIESLAEHRSLQREV